MIYLIGERHLEAVVSKIGNFFERERLTAADVITALSIMLVVTAKHAGFSKERILNYIVERWDGIEPGKVK